MASPTVLDGSRATLTHLSRAFLLDAESKLSVPQNSTSGLEDYVGTAINVLDTSMQTMYERMDTRFQALKDNFADVRNQVIAIQINGLRRELDDPIEPVSALVELEHGTRHAVAKAFPSTIKEFWKLGEDKPALAQLAAHYHIRGWQTWSMCDSEDSDATQFNEMEDAIKARPHKCLQILASKWGLQYTQLRRPKTSRKCEAEAQPESLGESLEKSLPKKFRMSCRVFQKSTSRSGLGTSKAMRFCKSERYGLGHTSHFHRSVGTNSSDSFLLKVRRRLGGGPHLRRLTSDVVSAFETGEGASEAGAAQRKMMFRTSCRQQKVPQAERYRHLSTTLFQMERS